MTGNRRWPVLVLMIEDNPSDVFFLTEVLKQDGWIYDLVLLEDGQTAIDYVKNPASRRPDVVILDMNLPKRDGAEVLHTIRNNERYKNIPVAVLSTSPKDVVEHQLSKANLSADCTLTKPADFDEYLEVVRLLWECYEERRPC
jgi:two-component system, chemotaxis family, response regulator Rcp1